MVFRPANSIHFQGFHIRKKYTLAGFADPKIVCTSRVCRSEDSVHFQGVQIRKSYALPEFSVPKIVCTSRVFSSENSIHFEGNKTIEHVSYPSRLIFRKIWGARGHGIAGREATEQAKRHGEAGNKYLCPQRETDGVERNRICWLTQRKSEKSVTSPPSVVPCPGGGLIICHPTQSSHPHHPCPTPDPHFHEHVLLSYSLKQ